MGAEHEANARVTSRVVARMERGVVVSVDGCSAAIIDRESRENESAGTVMTVPAL
jgi:hypothetical protein